MYSTIRCICAGIKCYDYAMKLSRRESKAIGERYAEMCGTVEVRQMAKALINAQCPYCAKDIAKGEVVANVNTWQGFAVAHPSCAAKAKASHAKV